MLWLLFLVELYLFVLNFNLNYLCYRVYLDFLTV